MRKTLALLIGIGMLLAGCHTNQSTSTSQKTEDIALCDEYGKLSSPNDQMEWIKKHVDVICNGSFSGCIVSRHSITEQHFTILKNAYWANTQPKTTKKKWSEIKSNITTANCLSQKYICFTIEDQTVTNLVITDEYDEKQSCYSIALFNAIKNKYGLTNNDEFEFTLGKHDNKEIPDILFKVKGKYYDLTIDPMK